MKTYFAQSVPCCFRRLRALSLAIAIGSTSAISYAGATPTTEPALSGAKPPHSKLLTQEQLRSFVDRAFIELETLLPDGAGDGVAALLEDLRELPATSGTDVPVTLGQLKTIAEPFYDRLGEAGRPVQVPWGETGAPAWSDDESPATLEQAKEAFAFALSRDGESARTAHAETDKPGVSGTRTEKSASSVAGAPIFLPMPYLASPANDEDSDAGKEKKALPQNPSGPLQITIEYPAPGEKV